jgi:hypothetical protein
MIKSKKPFHACGTVFCAEMFGIFIPKSTEFTLLLYGLTGMCCCGNQLSGQEWSAEPN